MNRRIYPYNILKLLSDNIYHDKYCFLQEIYRKPLMHYLGTFYALIKMKHFTACKTLIKLSQNNT